MQVCSLYTFKEIILQSLYTYVSLLEQAAGSCRSPCAFPALACPTRHRTCHRAPGSSPICFQQFCLCSLLPTRKPGAAGSDGPADYSRPKDCSLARGSPSQPLRVATSTAPVPPPPVGGGTSTSSRGAADPAGVEGGWAGPSGAVRLVAGAEQRLGGLLVDAGVDAGRVLLRLRDAGAAHGDRDVGLGVDGAAARAG